MARHLIRRSKDWAAATHSPNSKTPTYSEIAQGHLCCVSIVGIHHANPKRRFPSWLAGPRESAPLSQGKHAGRRGSFRDGHKGEVQFDDGRSLALFLAKELSSF